MNLLKKIVRFIVHRVTLFSHKTFVSTHYFETDPIFPEPALKPRVEGYFTVIENVAEIDRFRGVFTPAQYELYKEWLVKYQDKMLAFISGDQLAYWAWFTVRREIYYEAEILQAISIPPDASFYYDSHTAEAFQRKGIYAASFYALPAVLERFGKKKLIFLIRFQDKAPMSNAKKFHFRCFKKYYVLNFRIFRFKFSRQAQRTL